jgi:hypothetical protein
VHLGEILATNDNFTNKGWNVRVVSKIMLSRADLLGLENRMVDDKKCTAE